MNTALGLSAAQITELRSTLNSTFMPNGSDYKDAAAFYSDLIVETLGFHPETMPDGHSAPRDFGRWMAAVLHD